MGTLEILSSTRSIMIRVSLSVAAVALVVLSLPPSLLAQQEAAVEPGAKVRVVARSIGWVWHVGTLVEMRADSLVLEVEGQASPLVLPLGSVTSLEVRRRQNSRALRGAVIGLVNGAAFGMAVGQEGEWDLRPVAVPLFGLTAAGIGALIGLPFKVDRWETVPLHRLRVGMVPQRGGRLTVGFSLRM